MMNRLMVAALCLVAGAAFAEDKAMNPGQGQGQMQQGQPTGQMQQGGAKMEGHGEMMGPWMRKVSKPDKKGIDAMFTQMEQAMKSGNMDACASMVDFPVFMVTDNMKGEVSTSTWDRQKYVTTMTESMKTMPKEMMDMKPKRTYEFLTDSMAIVHETHNTKMGKMKANWKSASLVINKDGKWMMKSMMEGGWGDEMAKSTQAPTPATDTKMAAGK
jgi:hypothetical protein